ncbi:MAG: GIY-YIG nuclease family protein [bacterium]
MKSYLYILYDSQKDKYYIGQTQNLADRFKRHQSHRSKYTRTGSWSLVYKELYNSRSEAFKRELYLKSLKSKIKIRELISNVGPIAQPG